MKNTKWLLLPVTFVTFCFGDVAAVNSLESQTYNNAGSKKLVAGLPVVHPFRSQCNTDPNLSKKTMNEYNYSTWNKSLTKEKNLENLVDKCLDKCFDPSFKILSESNGIYVGTLSSGEHLVFSDNVKGISLSSTSEEVRIVANSPDGIFAGMDVPSWQVPMFLEEVPLSFTPTLKRQLREVLLQLVQNPVGAKLLRVLFAVRTANNMPKLVFIPTRSVNVQLQAGDMAQRYLAQSNQKIANYLKGNMKDRFILYNPDFPLNKNTTTIKYDLQKKDFVIDEQDVPFTVLLFNAFNQSLHESGSRYSKEDSLIRSRSNNGQIVLDRIEIGHNIMDLVAPIFKLKKCLFRNNAGYWNMLGVTSEGIDLLCEAAFTSAENQAYIRISFLKGGTDAMFEGIIDQTSAGLTYIATQQVFNLTQTQRNRILLLYVTKGGDCEIYKAFLTREAKFPKFGVGQYECADLDPKTGEKLES